jgi:hypothetical protein
MWTSQLLRVHVARLGGSSVDSRFPGSLERISDHAARLRGSSVDSRFPGSLERISDHAARSGGSSVGSRFLGSLEGISGHAGPLSPCPTALHYPLGIHPHSPVYLSPTRNLYLWPKKPSSKPISYPQSIPFTQETFK